MATGATSDLLPVRKETKRRLARLKGSASYDALLRALLDAVPEAALLDRLRGAPRTSLQEPRERPPEKQLLIADLAAQRWRGWLASRRLVERGPRLFPWTEDDPGQREVRYATLPGRGLSP